MKYYINGVLCDTYVHLDKPQAGNTVSISEANSESHKIVVFFYCDDKPFPLNAKILSTVRCYISVNNEVVEVIKCGVGSAGEVVIHFSDDLYVSGQFLTCEIVVDEKSENGEQPSRYSSFKFSAAVVP